MVGTAATMSAMPPSTPATAADRTTSTGSAHTLDTPGRSPIAAASAASGGATSGMHGGGGSGGSGGGDSVLSQKVGRALEVRSDTPAMLAALDALADLPSYRHADTKGSGSGNGSGSAATAAIDPRTVRQAIEVDALRQARLLQTELSAMVETVAGLRVRIGDVAEAARMVGQEMRRDVVGISLADAAGGDHRGHRHHGHGHHGHGHHGVHHRSGGGHGEHKDDGDGGLAASSDDVIAAALRGGDGNVGSNNNDGDQGQQHLAAGSSSSLLLLPSNLTISPSIHGTGGLAAERRLASLLHSAFRNRSEAAARAEAVRRFLDRFDLTEEEGRLLDGYGFDEFHNNNNSNNNNSGGGGGGGAGGAAGGDDDDDDGMAFLDALEHARKIRGELVRTFRLGSAADASSMAGGGGAASSSATSSSSTSAASGLGLTSALRMMESLSARQEQAYERLYHFLTSYLDLHSRSVSNVPTRSGGPGGGAAGAHRPQQSASAQEDAMDAALRHPFVVRSLQVLRHKPSYHAHTLELVAASRRAMVTRRFLLALTSGYDGLPPIEMAAHDPVHYVGDMLALVFRIESEEADLAGGLLAVADCEPLAENEDGDNAGGGEENEDGHGDDDDDADDDAMDRPMSPAAVLSHATSGISRPLKSRVFQVVASLARHPSSSSDLPGEEGGPAGARDDFGGHGPDGTFTAHDFEEEAGSARTRLAQLYEICGLLLYYRSAFHKTVARLVKGSGGPAGSATWDESDGRDENALIQCIQDCLDEAATAFGASLRVYAATLPNLSSLSDESESALVQGTVAKICKVRMGSPGFFAALDPSAAGRANLEQLPTLSIEFLVDTAVDAAMSHCGRLDDAVALRNAVVTAKKAGLESAVAAKWDQAISDKERSLADTLIDGETRHVVETIGLAPVADALKNMEAVSVEGQLISSHPGLGPNDVQAAMREFYDSLYSPPTPSFGMIRDPVLRKYARSKTAQNVVDLYVKIYDTLRSDRGGYDDLSFLSMPPDQVKTLLSV